MIWSCKKCYWIGALRACNRSRNIISLFRTEFYVIILRVSAVMDYYVTVFHDTHYDSGMWSDIIIKFSESYSSSHFYRYVSNNKHHSLCRHYQSLCFQRHFLAITKKSNSSYIDCIDKSQLWRAFKINLTESSEYCSFDYFALTQIRVYSVRNRFYSSAKFPLFYYIIRVLYWVCQLFSPVSGYITTNSRLLCEVIFLFSVI